MRKTIRSVWRFFLHCVETDVLGAAAKTAFFFLMSIFPLCMFTGWALAYFDLDIYVLEGFLPADMLDVLPEIGEAPISNPILIFTTLWAASSAVWALMKGTGMKIGSLWKSIGARMMALLFTLCFLGVISLTLAFVAVSRWMNLLLVGGAFVLLLFALYRYTPGSTIGAKRAAITATAVAAVWLAVSRLFELYMHHLSRYEALYGSVGIFLGLALWVFIISFVIILGAKIAAFHRDSTS